MTTLCEKYKANCFSDIKGQSEAEIKIKEFVKKFPEKRAIILYGPSGTGKTSLAYALAQENKSEIFELNASHLRNKEQLKKILLPATNQASLFEKGKIILVDEVEGITSSEFGGLPELLEIINFSAFPVIITANKIWDKKFAELRKKSLLVELKEISYPVILNYLKEVAEKESLKLSEDTLKSIAAKSKGDARAALNDLSSISETISPEHIHERDREISIFEALKTIFKSPVNEETLKVFDKTDMTTDELFLWIEENVPLEYRGEELAKAYHWLAKADVFRGRIHRQQYWRFLVYENLFLSAGISSSKERKKQGFTKYNKPTRILKLWLAKQRYRQKISISEKYAHLTHSSKKQTLRDFNLVAPILKNPQVQKQLNLSQDELDFVKHI